MILGWTSMKLPVLNEKLKENGQRFWKLCNQSSSRFFENNVTARDTKVKQAEFVESISLNLFPTVLPRYVFFVSVIFINC